MIGNTDWSVPNQHNCKVLSGMNIEHSDLGTIVPYDFDYSGLVDADYAVPYEGLALESVRERRYRRNLQNRRCLYQRSEGIF